PALDGPRAPEADGPAPPGRGAEDDHDALLRRLRELGELHRSGILTDEEFTLAKQAILKRM
ncbi:SHOCT domain-containing protein, partial [Streptomyces sp. McG8]|nr:SHOCT domain-containing protein [Streptomyces sp. McG8]